MVCINISVWDTILFSTLIQGNVTSVGVESVCAYVNQWFATSVAQTPHGERIKPPHRTRITVNYPMTLSLSLSLQHQPSAKPTIPSTIRSSSCLPFPGKLSFHPVKLWFLCIWINEYTRYMLSICVVVPEKMMKRFTTLICFLQSVVCLLMWVLTLNLSLFLVMGLRFCTI